MSSENVSRAKSPLLPKPFFKWAGGKGQLLPEIIKRLPKGIQTGEIRTYIEPFVGGGAVFFELKRSFNLMRVFLSDINPELILVYKVIKYQAPRLIAILEEIEKEFLRLSESRRSLYFYKTRETFNNELDVFDFTEMNEFWNRRAAQSIFLNRTCFNGLFRVNRSGKFNVPYGKYANPKICDESNLLLVSVALENATIEQGDFTIFEEHTDKTTFVYFDPPYRPISTTSSFNSYSQEVFDDLAQLRLAAYFKRLSEKGAKLLLSNSDPKNLNKQDNFFEKAYQGFKIERVYARRNINSVESLRGEIPELLISNY